MGKIIALNLEQIYARLDLGKPREAGGALYTGVKSLQQAQSSDIAFCESSAHRNALEKTAAGLLLMPAELKKFYGGEAIIIEHPNPKYAFARLLECFYPQKSAVAGIHPSAQIADDVKLGADVQIGAGAVIESGTAIGSGCVIAPQCHLGEQTKLGKAVYLHPQVSIGSRCEIGARSIIHSGARIGTDGFGYARTAQGWYKLPHIGRVLLGEDVEVGANTCIDRGMLADTIIESGVKLDNLIQVAHNVRIGKRTAIAGCSGIAGSTTIGSDCMIAGSVKINGHIDIVSGTVVMAGVGVTKSIDKPGVYATANVMLPRIAAHRLSAILKLLPQFWSQLKNWLRQGTNRVASHD